MPGSRARDRARLARRRVEANADELEALTDRVAELEARVTALEGASGQAYPGEYALTGSDVTLTHGV